MVETNQIGFKQLEHVINETSDISNVSINGIDCAESQLLLFLIWLYNCFSL